MPSILILLALGVIGGVAVGLQSPMASMISQRLGILESVFIIHVGGALIALVPLLFKGGGNLKDWRILPWYTLVAGAFGLIVMGVVSYTIPRLGVTPSILLIVAGQMIIGAILDHYGLLDAPVHQISLSRVAGIAMFFFGVWLTMK